MAKRKKNLTGFQHAGRRLKERTGLVIDKDSMRVIVEKIKKGRYKEVPLLFSWRHPPGRTGWMIPVGNGFSIAIYDDVRDEIVTFLRRVNLKDYEERAERDKEIRRILHL